MERQRKLKLVEIGIAALLLAGTIKGYQHLEQESKKPQLLAKSEHMELYFSCEFTNRLLPTRDGYQEAYTWIMGQGKYDTQTGKQWDSGEVRVFVENSKVFFSEKYGRHIPPVEAHIEQKTFKGIYNVKATLYDRLYPDTGEKEDQPISIEELNGRAYCPSHTLYELLSKIPLIGKLL